jgi:DNA-binding NarL/FixJ family response regulator
VTRVFLIASARERERLGELLEEAGAEVVGAAASAEGATEELLETADVVIVGTNGEPPEEVLEVLQAQGLTGALPIVLLMTEQRPAAWASRALRRGVRGILPRNLSATTMHVALEAVAQGLTVFETSDNSLRGNDGEAVEFLEPLTARERDVLEMLAQGRGNKEIAAQLRISEHTVKFHVASILGKLGAATRTEAVSIALRRGLILF